MCNRDRIPNVQMSEITTRWDDAKTIEPGPVDQARVQALVDHKFDGAPVVQNGQVYGFASVGLLESLAKEGGVLEADDARLWSRLIDPAPRLDDLLRFVAEQPGGIVRAGGEDRGPGFFTLSDLNRHPVRVAIYPLFAELESKLAMLIKLSFSDPWDWLELINEDRRPRIIGYWEMSKRANTDIGPTAAAMLSDLGTVIEGDERLRNILGYDSKKKWKNVGFGGLNDLRHSVMHPVRPLISNRDDVEQLLGRIEKLADLIERVHNAKIRMERV